MSRRTLFIYLALLVVVIAAAIYLYSVFRVAPSKETSPKTPVAEEGPQTSPEEGPSLGENIVPVLPTPEIQIPVPSLGSRTQIETMAWIYPGPPTCGARQEYSDGRRIDILKPEYFMLSEAGELLLLTEDEYGCNGYSAQNVADLKKYSKEQYVTVSSSYSVSMDRFLTAALSDGSHVDRLVSFVVDNGLTGIEIDFEDFGNWDGEVYSRYKEFVSKLGDALHKKGKKLMIDGPATSNQTEENWFVWRYSDFVSLPVDKIVIMAYDYQYDQGVGEPISPVSWVKGVIGWTLAKFPDRSRISVGIPSYGYKGSHSSQRFSLLTLEQMKREADFEKAREDSASHEMTWQNGGEVYFYQSPEGMNKKLEAIRSAGVSSISVWHLGGNPWFTE